MYERHFGFREKPFALQPDPAFLFVGKQHSTALSLLEYSLENQAGFAVLTGVIGSGKTILVRHLLEHATRDVVVGLISNTHRNLGELMTWVLLAFGLKPAAAGKAELYEAFVDFLVEQYAAKRRTLLIVDEAQNLGFDALEELRLLSNINADKHQVLQTILVGTPELRDLLRHPELAQFAQRIAAYFHLDPLDPVETPAYIRHRITLAGGDPELFHADACRLVHRYSGGVPRVVNNLCDTALAYAYFDDLSRIDAELVRAMVSDKVQAGLFPLPEGIDADELPVAGSSKVTEAGGHAFSSTETHDDATRVPPWSHGAPKVDPPGTAAPTQDKAPQTAPGERDNQEHTETEQQHAPTGISIKKASDVAAPRTAQLGFPSSLTITGERKKVSAGSAVADPGGRHRTDIFAAYASHDDTDGLGNPEEGSTRGSPSKTPISPLPPERRASARRGRLLGLLAVGFALPVVFLAGQRLHQLFEGEALQARVTKTGQQDAGRPTEPHSVLAPAAEPDIGTVVNGTPPEPSPLVSSTRETNVKNAADPVAAVGRDFVEESARGVGPMIHGASTPDAPDERSIPASGTPGGQLIATVDAPPVTLEVRPAAATALGPLSADPSKDVLETHPKRQNGTAAPDVEKRITRLLRLAGQALVESRLTIPESGSAHYYYSRVLELDAGNAPANEGIDLIVRRYTRMARSALARNDYVIAQRYLMRGLRVQSDNSELLALKEEMVRTPQ